MKVRESLEGGNHWIRRERWIKKGTIDWFKYSGYIKKRRMVPFSWQKTNEARGSYGEKSYLRNFGYSLSHHSGAYELG